MGHGGQGNSFCSSGYYLAPSVFKNRVGDFVGSYQSMASGHSRSSSCDSSASSSAGYIEHIVSRFDTLAGVAIKYGVEVGDVKRMNGLVTDLQMFALKTLKIPLSGRHPPTSSPNSPGFSGKQPAPRLGKHPNPVLAQILKDSSSIREPEKRSVTSAMGLLRGYYGLSTSARGENEGTEMAVYKSDSDYHSEDEPFSPHRVPQAYNIRSADLSMDFLRASPGGLIDSYEQEPEGRRGTGKSKATTPTPLETFSRSGKSTPLRLEAAGDSGENESERANDRLCRRRAKGDGVGQVPENIVEVPVVPEAGANDRINVPLGKSTVLRQKILPTFEQETDSLFPVVNNPINGWYTSSDSPGGAARALGTSLLSGKTVEGLISKIRRSASNSTLQEERRPFKADSSGRPLVSQGTQSGVISSVLEGFPKPGVVRRNKAALD